MRNWRPISLLNVDFKLAARAIAARLLKVIHLVVAEDQTYGVLWRYIGENVAFLRDVVSYATIILSLDQEKAFDTVDWSFMYATLRKMGFGTSFLKWVNVFYTGVESSVNVNGYLSSFFSLSRGVRQGCPLSPLLYGLVAEVLGAILVPIHVLKAFVSSGLPSLYLRFRSTPMTRRWLCALMMPFAPVSLFTTRIIVAPVPSSIFPSPKAFGLDLGPGVLTRRLLSSGRRWKSWS